MVKKKGTIGIVILALIVFCFTVGMAAGSLPGRRVAAAENARFAPEYASLNDAKRAGNALNEQISAEGMVLMKNVSGALPLKETERKVSVFGAASANMIDGGTGSGRGVLFEPVTLIEAMEAEGFRPNPTLRGMYETFNSQTEIAVNDTNYSAAVENSYAGYADAAFIVVTRPGHEGSDLETGGPGGTHELEMTAEEKALFDHVKSRRNADGTDLFKKIVVLLNVGNVFEVQPYVDDARVQAVLYVGYGGSTGIAAAPRILTGAVNPSGRTVDVWPADLTMEPTWGNFGTNKQTGGTTSNTGIGPDGKPLASAVRSLDYEEGIYVGYRWYETAATIEGYYPTDAAVQSPLQPHDPYFNRTNGVVFPFGHGLSYTTFAWTAGTPSFAGEIKPADAGTRVTLPVTVKNTGTRAGKDVVQVYVRAPYGENAPIEKGDVSLISFAKTNLLAPDEEQTVNIEFDISDLASFDWNDANGNGFKGYELEPGEYGILLRTNSHTDKNDGAAVTFTVGADGIKYDKDGIDDPLNYNKGFGEETAKAVFSDENTYNTARVGKINAAGDHINATAAGDAKYVSRKNWYLPAPPTAEELAYSEAAIKEVFSHIYYGACYDKPTDPWYKTEADIPGYGVTEAVAGGWKQAPMGSDPDRVCEIQLKDMTGVPLDDPKWVEFMNQMTWSEMTFLLVNSYYSTPPIKSIGKPYTFDVDGPAQIRNSHNGNGAGTYWSCATLISCTYNTELCYEQGRQIGMEGMLIGFKADGYDKAYVNGWYGPGLNTHRTAFGGRNFEYYSQDGVQGGMIGGAVIGGAVSQGMHVYGKHFVVNDQDTDRKANGGVSVWCNEQALREIYLRQFEYAIEYGKMNGTMNSHGRLGLYGTQNNFYLNNIVTRREWGFEGVSVTDLVDNVPVANGRTTVSNADTLIRCGSTFLGNLANQTRGEELWFDGRILDGYYDAATNRVIVPESLTVSDWKCNNPTAANTQNTSYTAANVTAGAFTLGSPTQWYWVRSTAQSALYLAANTNQMQAIAGSKLVGAYVSVHYNDGVTPDGGFIVDKGEKIEALAAPVVPEGKRFAGWFTNEACTEPADFTKAIDAYTGLYALIVDSNQYSATFDLNFAGAPAPGKIMVNKEESVTPPPYEPERAGYRFGGWYLDADCDYPAALGELAMNDDMTFYAKWIPLGSYEVRFDLNYDGVFGERTFVVPENGTLSAPTFTPTRTGYEFGGWFRDPYCNAPVDYDAAVTADMTLYAKWTRAAEKTPITDDGPDYAVAFFVTLGVACGLLVLGVAFAVVKKVLKKKKQ